MRAGNAWRATGTGVLVVVATLLLGAFSDIAGAQTPAGTPDSTPGAASRVPDAGATIAAMTLLERWVRGWEVPAEATPSTPAVGACVVLRLDGAVLARGEALSPRLDTPDADVLRRAAAQAIQRATPKLGIPNDALREERLREVAKRVSISLELAGDFAVIEPATWGDVDGQLSPGLDGVAARVAGTEGRASGSVETVYPSVMLASGATGTLMVPSRALSAAVAQAVGEGGVAAALETPAKLRAERAVRMYRFRVSHVVQGPKGTPPTVLYRGSQLLPPASVLSRAELVRTADRLAAFLKSAADPVGGTPRTEVTTPDRALALLALAESRGVRTADAAPDAQELASTLQAYEWLESIDPRVACLAACVVPDGEAMSHDTVRRFAATVSRSLLNEPELATVPPGPDRRRLALDAFPATLKAVPLYAAARVLRREDAATLDRIDAMLRGRYSDPEASIVAQMPWLGRAELALAARRGVDTIPAAVALRDMRSQLWQHQLTLTDTTPDTLDMSGGIVFTAGLAQGKGTPYPTWHCARPLAFVATMLGDARLTEPSERPRETVRLMQALRFIRQLQVDEASAWAYPNPAKAIGGIRSATWDFSQPVDASAMALMVITEALKSLDALAAQPPSVTPASTPVPAQPKPNTP